MSKWDRLVKYLNTTDAKPESVEALIKNTWKPKGKKTKRAKTGDHAIIKRAWVYTVCHAIYNRKGKIDNRINDWVSSKGYKINYNIFHPVKVRNSKTKKLEWAEDRENLYKKKTLFQHYNAVKALWNKHKTIRKELEKNKGKLDYSLLASLMAEAYLTNNR